MSIIDPVSNKMFSIFEKNGRELLKQYIATFMNGGASTTTTWFNDDDLLISDIYHDHVKQPGIKVNQKQFTSSIFLSSSPLSFTTKLCSLRDCFNYIKNQIENDFIPSSGVKFKSSGKVASKIIYPSPMRAVDYYHYNLIASNEEFKKYKLDTILTSVITSSKLFTGTHKPENTIVSNVINLVGKSSSNLNEYDNYVGTNQQYIINDTCSSKLYNHIVKLNKNKHRGAPPIKHLFNIESVLDPGNKYKMYEGIEDMVPTVSNININGFLNNIGYYLDLEIESVMTNRNFIVTLKQKTPPSTTPPPFISTTIWKNFKFPLKRSCFHSINSSKLPSVYPSNLDVFVMIKGIDTIIYYLKKHYNSKKHKNKTVENILNNAWTFSPQIIIDAFDVSDTVLGTDYRVYMDRSINTLRLLLPDYAIFISSGADYDSSFQSVILDKNTCSPDLWEHLYDKIFLANFKSKSINTCYNNCIMMLEEFKKIIYTLKAHGDRSMAEKAVEEALNGKHITFITKDRVLWASAINIINKKILSSTPFKGSLRVILQKTTRVRNSKTKINYYYNYCIWFDSVVKHYIDTNPPIKSLYGGMDSMKILTPAKDGTEVAATDATPESASLKYVLTEGESTATEPKAAPFLTYKEMSSETDDKQEFYNGDIIFYTKIDAFPFLSRPEVKSKEVYHTIYNTDNEELLDVEIIGRADNIDRYKLLNSSKKPEKSLKHSFMLDAKRRRSGTSAEVNNIITELSIDKVELLDDVFYPNNKQVSLVDSNFIKFYELRNVRGFELVPISNIPYIRTPRLDARFTLCIYEFLNFSTEILDHKLITTKFVEMKDNSTEYILMGEYELLLTKYSKINYLERANIIDNYSKIYEYIEEKCDLCGKIENGSRQKMTYVDITFINNKFAEDNTNKIKLNLCYSCRAIGGINFDTIIKKRHGAFKVVLEYKFNEEIHTETYMLSSLRPEVDSILKIFDNMLSPSQAEKLKGSTPSTDLPEIEISDKLLALPADSSLSDLEAAVRSSDLELSYVDDLPDDTIRDYLKFIQAYDATKTERGK